MVSKQNHEVRGGCITWTESSTISTIVDSKFELVPISLTFFGKMTIRKQDHLLGTISSLK